MSRITTFLTFNDRAEEAVTHYVSIFPNSRIVELSRYGVGGPFPEGTVMTVTFELDGQRYVALNGGPHFAFSEAISLSIECDNDQAEIDRLTERLTEGGGLEQPCGWVRDRFGVSWQITPKLLVEVLSTPDRAKARRAFSAMLGMKRIDVRALLAAAAG